MTNAILRAVTKAAKARELRMAKRVIAARNVVRAGHHRPPKPAKRARVEAPPARWVLEDFPRPNPLPAIAPPARWHVLRLAPGTDKAVEADLTLHGFPAWCPRSLRRRTKGDVVREVFPAYLAGYVFAAFDAGDAHWARVLAFDGVLGVLRSGDRPMPVPEAVMVALAGALDGPSPPAPGVAEPPVPGFAAGDVVRLTGGAFAGRDAIVESTGPGFLRALLDMMGQRVPVTVPGEHAEALERAA